MASPDAGPSSPGPSTPRSAEPLMQPRPTSDPRRLQKSPSQRRSRVTFQPSQSPLSVGSTSFKPSSDLENEFAVRQSQLWLGPVWEEEDDEFDKKYQWHKNVYSRGHPFTWRGLSTIGCLTILILSLLALFVGYPVLSFVYLWPKYHSPGYGIGGVNASGQIPDILGLHGLIDPTTPKSARYKRVTDIQGRTSTMTLVFSDEFTTPGRTFFPGDDPFFEAVDLHYWATGNAEWYDPRAITTKDGALEITLNKTKVRDKDYMGGMLTSWNKFCFTGGRVEASVQLPGMNNVAGLWPAIWTMGNLGRAGYGATTDGLWPYSYDACDYGAAPNQTIDGQPQAAVMSGDASNFGHLSWQPGQKLSRCVCPGEAHPGPKHKDGTFVGRAAPEIDLFEAQIEADGGKVSQSAQWAPFNMAYQWHNTSDTFTINDPTISHSNPFLGLVLQQATSVVTKTNQNCYDQSGTGCYSVYGMEYKPGFDDAYIRWITNDKDAWMMKAAGVGADIYTGISDRPISQEPMYIIMNLGISQGFGYVDFDHLKFPTKMKVDWIRVYQYEKDMNIGCDPEGFPTAKYIERFPKAYNDPNVTTWKDLGEPWPKNSITGTC
ncbi:glycoside hydrolase family 16 protein [Flagelloscypha sp. PMI_526]|nr:glycoside hydrolase family 16 protein [Flagelloscypha sp. PMI_526]